MLSKTILKSVFAMLLFSVVGGTLLSQDDGSIPTSGQNTETSIKTYDETGFDSNGFDRNGYDKDGYNKSGINKDGYDKNGVYRLEKTGHEKANDGNTGTTGNNGTTGDTGTDESSTKTQLPPGSVEEK